MLLKIFLSKVNFIPTVDVYGWYRFQTSMKLQGCQDKIYI